MADGVVYKRIVNYLKKSIDEGSLKIGDAIYSENMLCEKFNVSRTSVRKAIRQMVDENLLVSRQGLGTFVKSTGHGVIHNSLCMINHYSRILRYDFSDTYYMDLIYGVEEEVNRQKINFQMFSKALLGDDDVRNKMGHIKVDGAIVDGKYMSNGNDHAFLSKLTPHVVMLDGNPNETILPVVACDAKPAYATLLAEGVKRGGHIIYLHNDYDSRNRWCLDCMRKSAAALKLKNVIYVNYAENITYDNFANLDHYYLISRVLDEHLIPGNDCRTIIVDGDHAAIKAMNYLKRQGYHIPNDIAISGLGGMALAAMVDPLLTTCRIDARQMAVTAVELLLDIVNGTTSDHFRLVPMNIIRRASL